MDPPFPPQAKCFQMWLGFFFFPFFFLPPPLFSQSAPSPPPPSFRRMLPAPGLEQPWTAKPQPWVRGWDGAVWGQPGGELGVVVPRKDFFPTPLCDTPSASTDFLYKFIYFKLISYCQNSSQEGCPMAGGRGSEG